MPHIFNSFFLNTNPYIVFFIPARKPFKWPFKYSLFTRNVCMFACIWCRFETAKLRLTIWRQVWDILRRLRLHLKELKHIIGIYIFAFRLVFVFCAGILQWVPSMIDTKKSKKSNNLSPFTFAFICLIEWRLGNMKGVKSAKKNFYLNIKAL